MGVVETESVITGLVLWVTGIGVCIGAAVKVWSAIRKVSSWMTRVEYSIRKTEQHTNGEMDARFSEVRSDITDLSVQVRDVRETLNKQGNAIATMSGELSVLIATKEKP